MSNCSLENFTVPQKNYTKDILCVTATNTSAQIAITQQRSQYRNADDVKFVMRNVREWLEKYPKDVRNKRTLYFDYGT